MFRTLLGSVLIGVAVACSTGLGGAGDYEYIEDPVFTMEISPPIGWTYFPTKASDAANTQVWFFPGQANDSVHADQRADAELRAAMMDAIAAANIPLYGVDIANDYTSLQVENSLGNTKGVGPLYGKVESGALTQTAAGAGAAVDMIFQPYSKQVKVSVYNAGATRYNWNIVKNTFMQKLTLNFNSRFVGEVVISKT
ncbi:unnamed protein product [Auanema sp. JU1783]|nr:unnamed protein product [Auanema sp. JU1783]